MTWQEIHTGVTSRPEMVQLKAWLQRERQTKSILPVPGDVMNAFKLTPYDDVRWVILGQDPYPNRKDAHGLAFSSLSDQTPASLRNIFKEIKDELYPDNTVEQVFKTNNLTKWAKQGILLINTVLTVEEGSPNSHQGKGWEVFTEHILRCLNKHPRKLVFMFWGKQAQKWMHLVTDSKHLKLMAAHPSPYSADEFFGCMHFAVGRHFVRDDYFDLRPYVDNLSINSPLRSALRDLYRQNNIIFDELKAANLPLGFILPDIQNHTDIDLSLS